MLWDHNKNMSTLSVNNCTFDIESLQQEAATTRFYCAIERAFVVKGLFLERLLSISDSE